MKMAQAPAVGPPRKSNESGGPELQQTLAGLSRHPKDELPLWARHGRAMRRGDRSFNRLLLGCPETRRTNRKRGKPPTNTKATPTLRKPHGSVA